VKEYRCRCRWRLPPTPELEEISGFWKKDGMRRFVTKYYMTHQEAVVEGTQPIHSSEPHYGLIIIAGYSMRIPNT
jgi:hypothetical protein